MTQVDFHVLPAAQQPQRFACGLVAELRLQGQRLHLHTSTRAEAEALDDLLWTFRDISFLPHCLLEEPDAALMPVTIGWDERLAAEDRILINLADEVPAFATAFQRVVEMVPDGAGDKERARARYRRYRDLGLTPQTHNPDSNHDDVRP